MNRNCPLTEGYYVKNARQPQLPPAVSAVLQRMRSNFRQGTMERLWEADKTRVIGTKAELARLCRLVFSSLPRSQLVQLAFVKSKPHAYSKKGRNRGEKKKITTATTDGSGTKMSPLYYPWHSFCVNDCKRNARQAIISEMYWRGGIMRVAKKRQNTGVIWIEGERNRARLNGLKPAPPYFLRREIRWEDKTIQAEYFLSQSVNVGTFSRHRGGREGA